MRPIRIRQGTDKIVSFTHDFEDLAAATAINIYIGKDSSVDITKTLGDGVTEVTSETFTLTIADSDTENLKSGAYQIQAKITTADGYTFYGGIRPETVQIIDTVWTGTA